MHLYLVAMTLCLCEGRLNEIHIPLQQVSANTSRPAVVGMGVGMGVGIDHRLVERRYQRVGPPLGFGFKHGNSGTLEYFPERNGWSFPAHSPKRLGPASPATQTLLYYPPGSWPRNGIGLGRKTPNPGRRIP